MSLSLIRKSDTWIASQVHTLILCTSSMNPWARMLPLQLRTQKAYLSWVFRKCLTEIFNNNLSLKAEWLPACSSSLWQAQKFEAACKKRQSWREGNCFHRNSWWSSKPRTFWNSPGRYIPAITASCCSRCRSQTRRHSGNHICSRITADPRLWYRSRCVFRGWVSI